MMLRYNVEMSLHGFCESGSGALEEFKLYVEEVLYPVTLLSEVIVGERYMEINVEILEMNRDAFERVLSDQILDDPYVEGCTTRLVS